jgi:Derlin-2/3
VVTRAWLTLSLGLTCAGNFGVISVYKFIFNLEKLKEFEVWRLVAPFCYVGGWSFPTLISLFMLVQYSKQYEASPYNTGAGGGTADYAFCLGFGALGMLLSYPFVSGFISPLFSRNLTFYVLYVWAKQSPTAPANVWGVPLQAQYLPFAYIALNLVMGNPYLDLVHGLVIGHVYYFLVDVAPAVYGKDVLHTPQFMIDYFGVGAYVPPAGGAAGQGNNVWAPPGRVNAPRGPAAAATIGGLGGGGGGGGAAPAAGRGGYDWGTGGQTLGR